MCLVLTVSLAGPTTPVAGADGQAAQVSPEQSTPAGLSGVTTFAGSTTQGDVVFAEKTVRDARGDVVDMTLQFSGSASEATVVVGSSDIGFKVRATVRDRNDDGTVVVHWNTANSDSTDGGVSVAGSDDIVSGPTVLDGVDQPPGSADYPLEVRYDGAITDVATAILESPQAESLTTHTAPESARPSTVSEVRDVASSSENGRTVAVSNYAQDTVAIRLSVAGIEGYVSDASDFDDQSTGIKTVIEENPSTVATNENPVTVDVADARLVSEDDTYFLVFDAEQLLDGGATVGDKFDVTFRVDNGATDGELTLSGGFELVRGSSAFDKQGGTLLTPPTADSLIGGRSTWSPGTELTVEVKTSSDAASFVKKIPVEVSEDGTWSARFDFSAVPEGQSFEATLRHAATGQVEATADGEFGSLSASVSFSDQAAEDAGTLVVVDSVSLSEAGFVAIHRGGPSGSVIGVSDYLSPGSHEDVEIRLREAISSRTDLAAVVHLDSDADRTFDFVVTDGAVDGPYLVGGSTVSATATVGLNTPTPTPEPDTPTPTPEPDTPTPEPDTPTPTPFEPDTETEVLETSPPPGADSGPGLGLAVGGTIGTATAGFVVYRWLFSGSSGPSYPSPDELGDAGGVGDQPTETTTHDAADGTGTTRSSTGGGASSGSTGDSSPDTTRSSSATTDATGTDAGTTGGAASGAAGAAGGGTDSSRDDGPDADDASVSELATEAEAATGRARDALEDGQYAVAAEEFEAAISALEGLRSEDAIDRADEELSSVRSEARQARSKRDALGDISDAIERGEEFLRDADEAFDEDDNVVARLRYRQARDSFEEAIDLAEREDIDAMDVTASGHLFSSLEEVEDRFEVAKRGFDRTK
jgi:hypothetical protein